MKYSLQYSIVAVLFFLIMACKPANRADIVYEITPLLQDSIPLLRVRVEFEAEAAGLHRLKFENQAWGQDSLHNTLREIKLISPEGRLEINRDSGWIEIRSSNPGSVLVEYLLEQDFSLNEAPLVSYRPIIQPDYFHVFSHNLFMVPESWEGDQLRRVELSWTNFPEDWVVHNSFGKEEKVQVLEGISLEEFHSAIFVGGDFRLYEEQLGQNRVVLASRGDWVPFSDQQALEILMETLKVQRDFWQDHSQEFFTVIMRPMVLDRGSAFQGTGLTNSFATSMTNNTNTDVEQLIYLFNHELQHNWTGHQIRNANEEAQYWFSEGFTDYFTIKNISSNGIGGYDERYFLQKINEIVRNLYTSPVSEAPNSEINYKNFWADRNYSKLPYYRGALYAFYLDLKIVEASAGSRSLDDLMREILQDAKTSGQLLSHDYFLSRLRPFLGKECELEFEHYIENGKLIDLHEWYTSRKLDFKPSTEVFDLGFTMDEGTRVILEVRPESEAFKAGLRADDIVIGQSIYYDDISEPVYLKIRRGKREIEFNFRAVREAPIARILETPSNRSLISSLF